MFIQHYAFTVRQDAEIVYEGTTYFGFFIMAYITIPNPIKLTIGAMVILRVLNISRVKIFGSSLPPPESKIYPSRITAMPAINR